MTNDELEQYIYERTRQFVGQHVLQVVNELLAASTASDKQEAVGEVYTIQPFTRYDKHGIGHEAGGVSTVRLFKDLPVGTKLYAAPPAKSAESGKEEAKPVAYVYPVVGTGAADLQGNPGVAISAPRPAAQDDAPRLDKPAQVSATRFGKGVKWSTVIGAAQRYYEFMQTPEKEALRIENARTFIEGIHAAPRLVKLFEVLMQQNIVTSDESYLSLRCVGVPPTEQEFASAVQRAIDVAIAKEPK